MVTSARRSPLNPLIFALALGLATAAFQASLPGAGVFAAQAPAQNTCGLLTTEEVQALVPEKEKASSGIADAFPALESSSCRYSWGTATKHYTLAISVNPASRAYSGMSADAIKQTLVSTVRPGTADATIPNVGDAAVFRADSSVNAGASAYVKNRIIEVRLDGYDARDKKDQLISLLKSAASRL